MTDYMKEAERLSRVLEDIAQTALRGAENEQIRGHLMDAAEMLAHIQRGAVPEPEQIAQWAAGWRCFDESDGLTGEAAMLDRIAQAVHRAMLAAAPAPDHFRDAAKMMAEPADAPYEWEYYYMDSNCHAADSGDPNCICWHGEGRGPYNTARHDDEDSFLEWRRVKAPAPAEVPMPEPVARILEWRGRLARNPPLSARTFDEFPPSEAFPAKKDAYWSDGKLLVLADEARTYGDAREAAGYARGRDDLRPLLAETEDYLAGPTAWTQEQEDQLRARIDAALRGEVK